MCEIIKILQTNSNQVLTKFYVLSKQFECCLHVPCGVEVDISYFHILAKT